MGVKRLRSEPIKIPADLVDKILVLRAYVNDFDYVATKPLTYRDVRQAKMDAIELMLQLPDVLSVVLTGIDIEGNSIESDFVWYQPDARPWYVTIKQHFQDQPDQDNTTRYATQTEARKAYYEANKQRLFPTSNAVRASQ